MNATLYAILWLSFGFVHSLLTLPSVQNRLKPFFNRSYRLAYNVFAAVHVVAVLMIGRLILSHESFEFLSASIIKLLFVGISVAGVVVILLALRQYDLGLFAGTKQLKQIEQSDSHAIEPLNISGLNRWVRHPLYSGAFLFLWGNAVSVFGLLTAIFASLYFIIGSRYEERKLIKLYGEDYLAYKARVPAFIPWR